jgi:hypothetical protein
MCTDLYYCDHDDLLYGNEDFHTVYHEHEFLQADKIMDAIEKLSLGFLGSLVVIQFGLIIHNIFKLCRSKKKPAPKLFKPTNKKLKIIRGVPGVGKRSYIYYLENGLNREFTICDINDYFTKKKEYNFVGKELAKAEADTMNCFINAIKNKDPRIYVIGTFEKTWMYKNFTDLAKINGYVVDITELECTNVSELSHFNKRSRHNIPSSKSLKAFNEWENDNESYKRCPYLEDNTKLLHARRPCLIKETDSDEESDEFTCVPNIKNLAEDSSAREVRYVDVDTDDSSDDYSSSSESEDDDSCSDYDDMPSLIDENGTEITKGGKNYVYSGYTESCSPTPKDFKDIML